MTHTRTIVLIAILALRSSGLAAAENPKIPPRQALAKEAPKDGDHPAIVKPKQTRAAYHAKLVEIGHETPESQPWADLASRALTAARKEFLDTLKMDALTVRNEEERADVEALN